MKSLFILLITFMSSGVVRFKLYASQKYCVMMPIALMCPEVTPRHQ